MFRLCTSITISTIKTSLVLDLDRVTRTKCNNKISTCRTNIKMTSMCKTNIKMTTKSLLTTEGTLVAMVEATIDLAVIVKN